jgi:hypothetical protein
MVRLNYVEKLLLKMTLNPFLIGQRNEEYKPIPMSIFKSYKFFDHQLQCLAQNTSDLIAKQLIKLNKILSKMTKLTVLNT